MVNIVISGTGLYTPQHSITNTELINSYNDYVRQFNERHANDIEQGKLSARIPSSAEFITKASGIEHRYVMHKDGMLDSKRMKPRIPHSNEPEVVTMGLAAARQALARARVQPEDIDLVIVTTTNHQRPYPSIAVEIQHKLGCTGHAYDMGIACSSATFGIIAGSSAIKAEAAQRVLVVNPEYASPQVNLTSRDSHFIFGDAATAVVLEPENLTRSPYGFIIRSTRQETQYSNNIKCEGNYTDHCQQELASDRPYFTQAGRKVFKELLPMVTSFIEAELTKNQLGASDLKRYWLHQANINMNLFAAKKILGRAPSGDEAPTILQEYANTASSGSIIAFHKYQSDFKTGEIGLICSFGAGYSIGSLLIQKQ